MTSRTPHDPQASEWHYLPRHLKALIILTFVVATIWIAATVLAAGLELGWF